MRRIPGVARAELQFGAGKIIVYGEHEQKDIKKTAAREGLKIISEYREMAQNKLPIWKQRSFLFLFISVLLLIGGAATSLIGPEKDPVPPSLFYALTIILSGYSLLKKGIRQLIRLEFNMNTLMTIAIIGACAIGEWGEGAVVAFLFAISERLEQYSMEKARRSLKELERWSPEKAVIKKENREKEVPVEEVTAGEIMIVRPGQKLALDGVIVSGVSSVNQAAITGESTPVMKKAGEEVFAGTLNEEGWLEVRVTKRADETTLAKIIRLIEEAQEKRAPAQAFVDRFATYYTPIIMALALGLAVVSPVVLNTEWHEAIYTGLALLVAACPCALVISTPVAIVTAIGNAARNGVLIKGGVHLENVGKISAIVFDKTGTLTQGYPVVTDIISLDKKINELKHLQMAAAIEQRSSHPLARAIVRRAEVANINPAEVEIDSFRSLTGMGVNAQVNGKSYWIGSPGLFRKIGHRSFSDKTLKKQIYQLQNEGKTVILFGTKTSLLLLLALADPVRQNSRETLLSLKHLGIQKFYLLTGDHEKTARAISRQLGMTHVFAEQLPHQKLQIIETLKKRDRVAMVGDGINDGPALACSDTGIAIGGGGNDTALEVADIVLTTDDFL